MIIYDICEIKTGFALKGQVYNDPNGNVNVIQMRDVNRNNDLLPTAIKQTITQRQLHNNLLEKGDLLFISRGYNNNAVVFEMETPHIASSSFFVLKPKQKGVYNPHYLAWLINSSIIQKKIYSIRRNNNVIISDFGRIEIELPDMDKQNSIAKAHDLIKRQSTLRKDLTQKEKELIESYYRENYMEVGGNLTNFKYEIGGL